LAARRAFSLFDSVLRKKTTTMLLDMKIKYSCFDVRSFPRNGKYFFPLLYEEGDKWVKGMFNEKALRVRVRL